MNVFDRRIVLIILLLVLILGGIILAGSRQGLPAPRLNGMESGETITAGSKAAFTLVFPQPVDRDSVEAHFVFEPRTAGRFVWTDDRQVTFKPESPLLPGQDYAIRLTQGILGKQGAVLQQGLSWQVVVRAPGVVYLSPSQAPEIWQVSDFRREPVRLTGTGGRVYDYTVSSDGSRIAYSIDNDQNGKDLWEIRLPGGEAELLLSCGADWCTGPAYSPEMDRIAYSRRVFSGAPGSAPGAPRLWMLRTGTGETDLLFIDANIGGQAAGWSLDGRFLAFVDEMNEGVRVVDFAQEADFFLPTGPGASFSWSPDSQSIFITQAETTSAFPYVLIYRVDISTQAAALWTEGDTADYSVPVVSMDGAWAAIARRAVDGGPGKQLWLARADGSLEMAITDDPLASYASYRWDPGGSVLIYQRLQVGGSGNRPDVMVWDRTDGSHQVVAEDAFLPQWIP